MDDERALARKLLGITHRMKRSLDAELRHSSREALIDPAHFGVMMNLRHRALSIGELAQRFEVSPPSMSKTVTALVNRGWVERARSQEDRRVVRLYLTGEGRTVLGRMRELVDQAAIQMLSVLSPEERRQLSAGLDTLYKALGEPFSDEPPAPSQIDETEEQLLE